MYLQEAYYVLDPVLCHDYILPPFSSILWMKKLRQRTVPKGRQLTRRI